MNAEEIKFRAKSKKTGQWVYGSFIQRSLVYGSSFHILEMTNDEEVGDIEHEVDYRTLGQYVGKIKTGYKIYINDIIQHGESIRIIEYRNGNTCAIRPSKTETILLSFCESPKLLGNIFDNPELLVDKAA